LRNAATAHAFARDRARIFEWQRAVRRDVHKALEDHFKKPVGPADADVLGLDPAREFEVHTARFAMRVGPDGQLLSQAILGLLQTTPKDDERPAGEIPIEGGCTVIADLGTRRFRYIIRKNARSESRRDAQRAYAAIRGGGSAYWGAGDEPFAALHGAAGGGH
jgi:hypothetical protein